MISWQTIANHPSPELEQFLHLREPAVTGISDRYRQGDLDARGRRGGHFHYLVEQALVFQGASGLIMPYGIKPVWEAGETARTLRKRFGLLPRIRTIMGLEEDVLAMSEILDVRAGDTVGYDLLHLPWQSYPPLLPPPIPDLEITRPTPAQWRSLLELQIAYEIEEVILPGRTPVPAHSKAQLLDSLSNHLVLVAHHRGRIISRVATNARGLRTDQIGGVYTDPGWRGQGVAGWLMRHLLHHLKKERRDASLFVKHNNPGAQQLYRGLGFGFVSLFRISYYP